MAKIIILAEVKQRELLPSIILMRMLQEKGHIVKIVNFLSAPFINILLFKPDIIINNGMRSDFNFNRIIRIPKILFNVKIVTLYAEQVLSNSNMDSYYGNSKILHNTDLHVCWGPSFYEGIITKLGYKTSCCIIGSYRLDVLKYLPSLSIREEFSVKYNLNIDKRWILISANLFRSKNEKNERRAYLIDKSRVLFAEGIKNLAMNFPEIEFIYRLHPATPSDEAKIDYDFFESLDNVHFICDYPISYWLKSVVMMIIWQSTSAVEGWVAKIPTVAFHPIEIEEQFLGWHMSCVTTDWNLKSLSSHVKAVVANSFCEDELLLDKREEFLKNYYYRLDYMATLRLIEEIEKIDSKPSTALQNDYRFFWFLDFLKISRIEFLRLFKGILKKKSKNYIRRRDLKNMIKSKIFRITYERMKNEKELSNYRF